MSNRSILFPDPLEQIKPEMGYFQRKVSYDYEDYENEKAQENFFQKSSIYNPVKVKNFEEWNKLKNYTNYLMNPSDCYDMYGGIMPSNQNRKMSTNSSDSSNVVDTLF